MASKTLAITYTADAAKALAAQKQIDAGHTRMQGGVAKTSSTFSKAFGSVLPLSFAAAGLAAVGAGKFIIDAATSEGEAVNAMRQTFEKAAPTVERFSDTSAAAFGISKGAALEAATGFGAMFDAAGLVTQESANMSVKMVGLAGDIASFRNQDPSEMLEKLRSGLAGEAEPLRQFGIFLTEDAVKIEAVSSGIAKQGQELTEAQKIQARYNIILEQSQKAQGDFGRTLGDSLPNQIRVFKAQLTDLAADVGSVVIPALSFLLSNINLLIDGFLGFAAVKFIPGLLYQIAIAAEAVGAQGLSQRVLQFAFSISQLGFAASTALAVDLAGLAYLITKIATGADPTFTDELSSALVKMAKDTPAVADALGKLAGDEIATAEATKNLTHHWNKAGKEVKNFGDLTNAELEEFSKNLQESVQVSAGEFEKFNDAFSTTPKELQKQLKLAVQIARTEHADLKAIFADKSLSDAQKQALASMPADQRHAWAEAGKAGKEQIQKDAITLQNLNKTTFKKVTSAAAGPAREGMTQVGRGMMEGAANGVTANQIMLSNSIRAAVRGAINAGKDEAGSASPSKEMMKLGVDMMVGLANGIQDAEQKAIDAAKEAIEKSIDKVGEALDKLKGKASSFRDAIRSGFSGFSDIVGPFSQMMSDFVTASAAYNEQLASFTGEGPAPTAPTAPDLSSFVQSQVSGASQLADVLEALKRQDASKQLLEQVAAGGAGAIPFAQELLTQGPAAIDEINQALKDIAKYSSDTGEALSKHFFGERIEKLENKLDRIHDDLRELNGYEREGHSHDIVMDGDKVAEGVRTRLIRTGQRNGGTGID